MCTWHRCAVELPAMIKRNNDFSSVPISDLVTLASTKTGEWGPGRLWGFSTGAQWDCDQIAHDDVTHWATIELPKD